jgi:hypothetical protein
MKPEDRIVVIRQSLTVFTCGLIGLLPIVGLLPGAYALVKGCRIRRLSKHNPARNYLRWGIALALLGALFSFVFALLVGASIVSRIYDSGQDSEFCF